MLEYKVLKGEIGVSSVNTVKTEKTQLCAYFMVEVVFCLDLCQWVKFMGFVRQNSA